MARLQGTEKGVPISERALDALKSSRQLDSLEYAAAQEIREMQDENEVMIPQLESSTVMDAFKDMADKYLYGKESLEACAAEINAQLQENA